MGKNKGMKNKDVDLDELKFFNPDEFNKFMSELLNQDSLNAKAREKILNKIEKVFKFYEELKKINESEELASNKKQLTNSLLSSNGYSDKEELIQAINNELTEISDALDIKAEQMGIYIVDHSSCTEESIRQRIDELENSANMKLNVIEEEIELIQNALSDNADYIESEIERKTEKLGNEIEGMTNKVNLSNQLAIIKPSFSKILKRILTEREIARKNYKFAPKSLKASYPAPKSRIRCFVEAYFEYADEKELNKDTSLNSFQAKLTQKSEKTKEIRLYLDSLQNKGNMELEKAESESNVALELLPALNKFVNIGNSLALEPDSIEKNINTILNKKDISYESIVQKINKYLPHEFSKPSLTLVVDNTHNATVSDEEPKKLIDEAINPSYEVHNAELNSQPQSLTNEITNIANSFETLSSSTFENNVENTSDVLINEITNTIDSLTSDVVFEPAVDNFSGYGLGPSEINFNTEENINNNIINEVNSDLSQAISSEYGLSASGINFIDNVDDSNELEFNNTISFENISNNNLTSSFVNEGKSELSTVEITNTIDNLAVNVEENISTTLNSVSSNDNITDKSILESTSKDSAKNIQAELINDDISINNVETSKISASSNAAIITTVSTAISKEELEKTRVRTQQRLQKAQEKFDKVTSKAQEQLERAKAKAQLEIKSIKDQALELLKEANATANTIIKEAEQRSLTIIRKADSTSQELLNTANQNAQTTINTAENTAINLIETAKNKVEQMKIDLHQTCQTLITTAEQKSNAIIITANRESEKVLTDSQNQSASILNSIDGKIQESKNKIVELKNLITNSENKIVSHKQDIEISKQKIKKIEELKLAAQQIDGLDDEINDFDSKLQKLVNNMKTFSDNIVTLEQTIKTSSETIITLTKSLDTIRPTLEAKAKTILEEAKIKSTSILEKSQSDSKYVRDKAKLDVKELKEKTNNEMREILLDSKEKAKNTKENAKLESARILEEANKKSKILLATAKDESDEIKEKANNEADMIRATKKAELDFILTEEDFKKVC